MDDFDARIAVLSENLVWRWAVHHDGPRCELPHYVGETLSEVQSVLGAAERADRADGDGSASGDTVAADAVCTAVTPANVRDDLNPVALEPAAYGTAAVYVP